MKATFKGDPPMSLWEERRMRGSRLGSCCRAAPAPAPRSISQWQPSGKAGVPRWQRNGSFSGKTDRDPTFQCGRVKSAARPWDFVHWGGEQRVSGKRCRAAQRRTWSCQHRWRALAGPSTPHGVTQSRQEGGCSEALGQVTLVAFPRFLTDKERKNAMV